jgi:2',3'-cyclic-nucleotide 2'-phosphodiesterase (5'-nucleotidase family)
MRPFMKRIHLPVLALLVALLAGFAGDAQSLTHVVIMHTNDLHGQLLPRAGVGGLAEIATMVRNAKPDLLLDAGDMFTGTPVCDEFECRPIIEVMGRLGYRAAAVGNHEFDFGINALRERVREAKFPILSANVKTGVEGIGETTVLEARGIRFGVIGLTTENLREVTHPKNLTNVRIDGLVETVERVLPALRRQSDFVVILGHIDDQEELRLARAFPEIRLIIGGHNHSALGPIRAGETLIAKTGNVGRNLGRIDLQFNGKTLVEIGAELLPVRNVRPDPEIAAMIKPYADQVDRRMSEVVGQATAEVAASGSSESPLANLLADALRAKTGTQIGLQNLGGIRTRIRQGVVSRGDVFEVIPFNNTVVTINLSGLLLKRTLARALIALSGIRIEYAPRRANGARLVSATLLDGTAIRDDSNYSVTTNDFLLAGGDGFVELMQGTDVRDTGIFIRDVLAEYIASRRTITPATDGRIRISR